MCQFLVILQLLSCSSCFSKGQLIFAFLIDNSTKNLHTLFPSHNLVEELINRQKLEYDFTGTINEQRK